MEQYAYQEMSDVEERLWWYVARRKIIAKILAKFVTVSGGRRARILEVGCGSGGNLPVLARFGELTAVEHDPVMREMAARRNLCPVLPGTLPNQLPLTERFDVICLFDVLEHLDKRISALKMLKSLFNNELKITGGG
jgi:SAM-dependent methyltransferase